MPELNPSPQVSQSKGATLAALSSYLIWGLVPIFWALLPRLDSLELLRARVLFTVILLLPVVVWLRFSKKIELAWNNKAIITLLCSAALIGFNWYLYVWAVTHGKVVESSLGYFINPLLNILLGTVVFREALPRLQAIACAIATAGILILTISTHQFPWIALLLASSFALYGVCKKTAKIHPILGNFLEVLLLLIPCFLVSPSTAIFQLPFSQMLFLPLAGLVSSVPLICFAYAAQRLPLSFMGFAQFLSPSMQFLIGIFYFHEEFTLLRGVSFMIIWLACSIFILDIFLRSKKNQISLN